MKCNFTDKTIILPKITYKRKPPTGRFKVKVTYKMQAFNFSKYKLKPQPALPQAVVSNFYRNTVSENKTLSYFKLILNENFSGFV